MDKIVASLKGKTFLFLLSAWLIASLAVGAFAYFDRDSVLAMLLSPWYTITYSFLLLCVTLSFVYEQRMPVGGYSALTAVSGLLMATLFSNGLLFGAAVLTGIFLDLMYARMFVRHTAWTLKMRIFSAIAPTVLWITYLSSFYMLRLPSWSPVFCVWSTAAVIFSGYLISFLIRPKQS